MALPDLRLGGFEGCVDDVKFGSQERLAEGAAGPAKWEEASPTKLSETIEGCNDLCASNKMRCLNGGQCRDHVDRVTCDCSLTDHEGLDCSVQGKRGQRARERKYKLSRVFLYWPV